MKVRLLGVDTPELRSRCEMEKCLAQHAKLVLQSFLTKDDSLVQLKQCVRDKYFRLTCDIILQSGESGVEKMLQSGLGIPYNGQTKVHNWCNLATIPTRGRQYVDACVHL